MAVDDVLLRAEKLRRVVGTKTIVREASFALCSGEAVAITGPSGAGKSSVLRLLNRLDAPTSGRVLLEGVDASTMDVRELRRQVGMVMQQANLFPGTVAENVRYGPALRKAGLPGMLPGMLPGKLREKLRGELRGELGGNASGTMAMREMLRGRCGAAQEGNFRDEPTRDGMMYDSEVEELLATVGLSGYAGRDVAKLSGGEAQRVSLARTLANRPLVLLLDEPTSALDDAAKLVVEEALRAAILRMEGACLIVTHDAAQAERLAQRTLVMRDGVLHDRAAGECGTDR